MSSPKEPGGRPANGDGSTEVPTWQNATRARPTEAPVRASAVTSAADPRRYITGSAAPDLSALVPPAERTDVAGLEPYRSELPDLSGPVP